jgi:hypothetical protein
MAEYTLSLALVDFLPVLFTAVGFAYVIRLVSSVLPAQGRIAFLGGLLVVAGGLFKAVWKLLMAVSAGAVDVDWMEDGLFVFMAPGYVLFTWSVWQVSRSVQGKRTLNAWLFPLILNLIMLGTSWYLFIARPDSPAWERILLSGTVLANVISGILLIVFAFRQRLTMAGWLFIANLFGIFILNGLARLPEQPISLQWIEEGINTFSWLVFAIAAGRVYQHALAKFGIAASVSAQLSPVVE